MKLKNKPKDDDDFPLLTIIKSLTPRHQRALGKVMIGDYKTVADTTLMFLLDKGLISLHAGQYYMEYHQNYAYCCWCEEQNFSEEE